MWTRPRFFCQEYPIIESKLIYLVSKVVGVNLKHLMKVLHMVTFILLVVGGLNWGLTALGYNVVSMILGSWPMVEKVVYLLVGLSAVVEVVTHKKNCRMCNAGTGV